MLTAKDRVSDKVTGLESGADDYIVKPFETLELLARIKACLRRTMPSEEKAEIGDLAIDFKAREVRVKGKTVELTPKEYELLRLFVANRGEPCSGSSSARRSGRTPRSIPGAGSSTSTSSTSGRRSSGTPRTGVPHHGPGRGV